MAHTNSSLRPGSSDEWNEPSVPKATAEEPRIPTRSEKKIRTVIRIFQFIGWPFSFILVPFGVGTVGMIIYDALTVASLEPHQIATILPPAIMLSSVAVAFLVAARGMKRKKAAAGKLATGLSVLMFAGVPLFTVIGFYCLDTLKRNYQTYCVEGGCGNED